MYKNRSGTGGGPPRRGRRLRGHHRRRPTADAAIADVTVTVGGRGGGRDEQTPSLKILWQLCRDHVAGLPGSVTRNFEASRLRPPNSPLSLPSKDITEYSN